MKVTVFTKLNPMGFYRLIWPAMVLQRDGYDVDIVSADPESSHRSPIRWMFDKDGRVREVTIPETDVLVIQRPTELKLYEAVKIWQRHGIRIVVDMDDNLRDLTPGQNPGAYRFLHSDPHISHRWVQATIATADHVTVSTQALAHLYGRHKPHTILRNCVPAAYLTLPRWEGENLIGWTGAVSYRYDDPSVVGGSLARLQARGYDFGLVGPVDNVESAFRLIRPPMRVGAVPFQDYPQAMSMFTVGIAPLKDNAFNRCKSWLKPLEFMALGVPVVMSDMYEYRQLVSREDGFFAAKVGHWYRYLDALLADRDLREEVSAFGRYVASAHTYEGNAYRWWEAWTGKGAWSTLDGSVHTGPVKPP